MSIQILPLQQEDIPGVVECIQEGFADDPYFKWVYDGTRFNKERNSSSLTARCLWGINNALFYVAKEVDNNNQPQQGGRNGRILGVSCWLAPQPASQAQSWYSWSQLWLLSFRQLLTNIRFFGRGGLIVKRYWIWKEQQTAAQKEIWTDKERGYYFCNIVTVRPDAQGKGIGRKLFEVVTQRADREGVKCYLESSKSEPNVKIYEKMGFELVKVIDCDDGGDVCRLFCMVREPKVDKS
ncbi:GNAT family acetyltransferase, putative [Talaromyces stipitatus ATCC 10500]|uniref:GNAT family acetyltransferase, putative n=1 Tax=Talaromyces stipitatus (strain ATCC 10500 / CBS 375.48 / QM 6759 / NRRL 1006) TaxID=441959 RepID=B8MK28_TALSN|nr:GNAT family acetyltransferase, putative [Talaromyces stipitatus ATCC 10500]EED14845.1 GNAT family acetyltransferase, putative [Talaromyces stipitatus ATCC 10500]